MRISLVVYLLLISFFVTAQSGKRITRQEYIDTYKEDAIREMHVSGIPASITLAQGILESGDGNSTLARKANNHFGIKCHSSWTGKRFYQDDDAKNECFRKYKTVLDSYHDHSEFLKRPRYAQLFELKITDYKGWAKGLKAAGYATNPRYPQLLIKIIEDNELHQYDEPTKRLAQTKVKEKNRTKSKEDYNRGEYGRRNFGYTNAHDVLNHENNIKYIRVRTEDTFEKIAQEFDMGLWQLYKYNDIPKGKELFDDGILYLQPKRNRAKSEFHYVQTGETMWDISQKYGVKLKKLYRKNRMNLSDVINPGDKLYLKKKKPLN